MTKGMVTRLPGRGYGNRSLGNAISSFKALRGKRSIQVGMLDDQTSPNVYGKTNLERCSQVFICENISKFEVTGIYT